MYVSMFATQINDYEAEAIKRAEIEHAPNIAMRMNPITFRTEYYDKTTGKVVSTHV